MTRTRLDDDLDRYYAEHYDGVVHSGVGGRIQDLFHRAVERPYDAGARFETVLELGATRGEHLEFVKHDYGHYVMQDIRDSAAAHEAAAALSRSTGRDVQFMVGDAQDLAGIEDESVDRLVSMCLLHHLDDPLGSLKRWREVVRPGGALSIFLPCDPGALWRAGRALSTFRAAEAAGYGALEVRYINACDHRNHVSSLTWMLQGVFVDDDVQISRYPFGIDSWNANLFMTFQIVKAA